MNPRLTSDSDGVIGGNIARTRHRHRLSIVPSFVFVLTFVYLTSTPPYIFPLFPLYSLYP